MRSYLTLLEEYLSFFPAVAVVGPRQCGKTAFVRQACGDEWRLFDLERDADLTQISRDPDLFLRLNPEKVIIDEAQLLPQLFPALRVAIDEAREQRGGFIVTGSSSPDLLSAISESLAGRIGIIELAPLSCTEISHAGMPRFAELLCSHARPSDYPSTLEPRCSLAQAHAFWLKGGYPEPWLRGDERFHAAWMMQYVDTYVNRDIARLFPGLNRQKFRLLIHHLAGLSGTVLNLSDIARGLGVSQPTVRDYLEIAHGTFLWRTIPAFTSKSLKRLVRHPKGYLRDSGLLHHLLHITTLEHLLTHPRMGSSWEGFVAEHIIRSLTMMGCSFEYSYYRTAGGAEVGLVLEGDFGIVPIEITYTQAPGNRDLRNVREFMQEFGSPVGFMVTNDTRVRLLAACHGGTLNLASISRDIGVSQPTCKQWLTVLEASYVVMLLPPYFRNFGKRLTKSPKLYFVDPGLAAYLTRQPSPDALTAGSMGGAFFEGLVVTEALKAFTNAGQHPDVFYWRSHDGLEVDLLVQAQGKLHPIEIKLTATPTLRHAEGLRKLAALFPSEQISSGKVVCGIKEETPLVGGVTATPWEGFVAWINKLVRGEQGKS